MVIGSTSVGRKRIFFPSRLCHSLYKTSFSAFMKFRDFSGLTLYFCNPYIPGDVTNNSEVNDFNTLLPRPILTIIGQDDAGENI